MQARLDSNGRGHDWVPTELYIVLTVGKQAKKVSWVVHAIYRRLGMTDRSRHFVTSCGC